MTRDSYKRAFQDVKRDILRILKKRQEYEEGIRIADAELRTLSDSVKVIGTLSGADAEEIEAWTNYDPGSQPGLTDAVLWALYAWRDRNPITVKDIRDTILKNEIMPLDKYKNALASIYTVIGRLVDSEDVDELTRGDDKRTFSITKKGMERITSRLSPVQRVHPPKGSLAERFFAEDDLKKLREEIRKELHKK
jgi:hypothetical protein